MLVLAADGPPSQPRRLWFFHSLKSFSPPLRRFSRRRIASLAAAVQIAPQRADPDRTGGMDRSPGRTPSPAGICPSRGSRLSRSIRSCASRARGGVRRTCRGFEKRIRRAIFASRQFQQARRLLAVRIGPGRRHQCFCLAQYPPAMPVGDRDVARTSEAAAARNSPSIADVGRPFWQACVQELDDVSRRLAGSLPSISGYFLVLSSFFQNSPDSSSVPIA